MLFFISRALNEPFGYDIQDIKLNRQCASIAYDLLVSHSASPLTRDHLIDPNHCTPFWLENSLTTPTSSLYVHPVSRTSLSSYFRRLRHIPRSVIIGLLTFTTWSLLITFLSWSLTRDDYNVNPKIRWWQFYVPLDSSTASYVSLGAFLLLGFWLSDAYNRYWKGLQLWQTGLQPKLRKYAFFLSISFPRGFWHARDRERLLSHIVAFPYVVKAHLRSSRDLTELNGILSPNDLASLQNAHNMPVHIGNVLAAYASHVDATFFRHGPGINAALGIAGFINVLEIEPLLLDFAQCDIIRRFPIPPAFTTHLQLCAVFWLITLPLTVITYHGFVSILYLLPIGYSIIKMLNIGREIADPFGYDIDDIPLEEFCFNIKSAVEESYRQTSDGTCNVIQISPYRREKFYPNAINEKQIEEGDLDIFQRREDSPTLKSWALNIYQKVPAVHLSLLVIATVWAVVATFLSWKLSKIWGVKGNMCPKWCSPIDIDSNVLSNVGFALFLILAFRASDGVSRYEDGAESIYEIRLNLCAYAQEVVQAFADGQMHPRDKERIVAHLVEIPLRFRDQLLDSDGGGCSAKGSLLTHEDRAVVDSSADPIDYLLKVVQAYFVTADMPGKSEPYKVTDSNGLFFAAGVISSIRISRLRELISKIRSVKRFPVVGCYRRHQYVFTALWLAFLPFSMTSQTGFFTILWAPLISYGVLALEALASKLVDPYGTDDTDLDVYSLFTNTANEILETVNSVGWECEYHVRESQLDESPRLGCLLLRDAVMNGCTLASLPAECGQDDSIGKFYGPHKLKMKPCLLAHITRSVPVFQLFAVVGWTCVACIISYYSRSGAIDGDERWWSAFLSVNKDVLQNVSFGTFTVLGFFVRAAFGRYHKAGSVFGDHLRGACHTLTTMFLSYWPPDAMHKGDKERIIGHIATLPFALKADLRHSRDLREARGLLSSSDLARVTYSENMSLHCISVIKQYYYKAMTRKSTIKSSAVKGGFLNVAMLGHMFDLEEAVNTALFLNDISIAPGFVALVNTLLIIFFGTLPFAIAELSGWFSILWAALVAYGVLGMYEVAKELQHPFGSDLNDFDLDEMSNSIVADILSVYNKQPGGFESIVEAEAIPEDIGEGSMSGVKSEAEFHVLFRSHEDLPLRTRIVNSLKIASRSAPLWVLFVSGLWSAGIVAIAYVLSENFSFREQDQNPLWFLSAISVDPAIMKYIGFALFLLLAFRLDDSHRRYVKALTIWNEDLTGELRTTVHRIFAGFRSGGWHKNDISRIAGHLNSFAVSLVGLLRNEDKENTLRQSLGPTDAHRVVTSQTGPDHCLDVVFGYLVDAQNRHGQTNPKFMSMYNYMRVIDLMRKLSLSVRSCARIVKIPLPYGYVHHQRIFMCIWILLLPLSLVETSGWVTPLWTVIISYGIIGIEHWASELSDPFGHDFSDIPLDLLCLRVHTIVKSAMSQFSDGLLPFIQRNRFAFESTVRRDIFVPLEKHETVVKGNGNGD